MASNVQKIPLVTSLARGAGRAADNRVARIGKCLPCSVVSVAGAIVTVKFEVDSGRMTMPHVTMPLFGPEYIRYPIQVGDKGMAVSADASLAQMSGLGDGIADLFAEPANLSALVFLPVGNKNLAAVDPDALTLYGKNGVVLRDVGNLASLTLLPHSITLTCGGHTLSIDAAGVHIDGRIFLIHTHTGVAAGTANTGPVF